MDASTISHDYNATFKNFTGNDYHIDIAKEAALSFTRKRIRVLNIGSGPEEIAALFVESVLPVSEGIVLVEPNNHSCQSYTSTTWYLENKDKLSVICETLESAMNSGLLPFKSFDLIVCSHVVYYWRLHDVPGIVEHLTELLSDDGIAVVTHCSQDGGLISAYRQYFPSYQHPAAFRASLDSRGYLYKYDKRSVCFPNPVPSSVYELVVEHNLVRHPDYMHVEESSLKPEQRSLIKEIAERAMLASTVALEGNKTPLLYNVVDVYWICRNRETLDRILSLSTQSS